ncbi:hypothetical protein LX15_005914 [Streptoalloteichus tenebrarius]|uniref:Uncharacterized protein n=1 Tax=Streptoalloteichus tenebrarius (strain ATCC 17920 / DSM 40477 / JCM 4838 / CBS 697.72 / NBRC 16177 / NCIMB 11028 / NRRL B-12390 / A12253. 1 / ISP 5477) TaxID=1933 RepID=A0ABT1I352_STRSD|nr:hypothetical protein [Streptoalloteichus tenebrarius]MCP2262180.1 hypothetical protein [Streptoalloteichus tenebrarius]BFE98981.1 hypothetical protein GCM10020241_06570 [Streptoalloteichus tenebrarius]
MDVILTSMSAPMVEGSWGAGWVWSLTTSLVVSLGVFLVWLLATRGSTPGASGPVAAVREPLPEGYAPRGRRTEDYPERTRALR